MTNNSEFSKNNMPLDPQVPMFSISVIAGILNIKVSTLRTYEKAKLILPTRSPKNRRLYSLNDIERCKFMQYLNKTLKINLTGVKIILCLLAEIEVKPFEYLNYVNKVSEKMKFYTNYLEIQSQN